MKLNKYIGIAVMPLLFTACENDMMESMQQKNQPIYTLSGIMDKGVNSRAQIQLGNPDESGEVFMWNEGDQFNLYQGGPESEMTFSISTSYSGNQSSATFSSETPAYPGKYVAVYPTVELDEENRFIFDFDTNLDFSKAVTQKEKDEVWKEYFKNNMYMIAQGELTAEGPNAIKFEQQCVLTRITYKNMSGSDQVLNYVSLCGQNQFYGTWRRQNMDMMGGSGAISSWHQLNFNGLQVAAGESTDIYILSFPSDFGENGIMEMYFSMPSGDRSVKVPVSEISANNGGATGFKEGMRYWFEVTSTKGGAVLSKHYSTKPITFKNVEFAKALQEELGSDMVTIDEATGYGTMIEGDLTSITHLNFSNKGYSLLKTLDGIENFKNLTYLSCAAVGLTECDLSQNTKLEILDMGANNELATLNIDNCTQLEHISLGYTALTTLNIPNKENVKSLGYGGTALSFNLNEFPNLTSLSLENSELESLDMIPSAIKAQLEDLTVYNNSLTSIDLTEYPNLTQLRCNENYIERLDISSLQRLELLDCGQQKDNITLILIANENQKNSWRSEWSKWQNNANAYLEGEEPKDIPEGGGTGNDFENGGEF